MSLDATKLVDQLSKAWEITKKMEDSLLSDSGCQAPSPIQPGTPSSLVGISPISTFVARKSLSNFVVPPFASHWGVVCDFGSNVETRMLYHLTFDPAAREVDFDAVSWKEAWSKHMVTKVGETPYGHTEIQAIGNIGSLSHSS